MYLFHLVIHILETTDSEFISISIYLGCTNVRVRIQLFTLCVFYIYIGFSEDSLATCSHFSCVYILRSESVLFSYWKKLNFYVSCARLYEEIESSCIFIEGILLLLWALYIHYILIHITLILLIAVNILAFKEFLLPELTTVK